MAEAPILVTGAAGGRRQRPSAQGSTGFHVTRQLLERGEPVRALVHRLDERSDELRDLGAEVVVGDLHMASAYGLAVPPTLPGLVGVGRATSVAGGVATAMLRREQHGAPQTGAEGAARQVRAALRRFMSDPQLVADLTSDARCSPSRNSWRDVGALPPIRSIASVTA